MKLLLNRIQREPALISGLLVALFNIFAVDEATSSTVITIVSAALPMLLAFFVRSKVTPVDAPKLGGNKELPPALYHAAKAVSEYLPAPIGVLFEKYGADAAWAIVKGVEKTLERPPTQQETDSKALEGV